jgi:cell division transport system permease protein
MNRVHVWLLRHLQTLIGTLDQMARAPLATVLTLAVLGITLALPAGLAVALDNLERLGGGWQRGAQISLFLKREVSEAGALKLAQQIRAMSGVITVEHISRAAALEEFRRQSGFGAALDALRDNPLPAVLVVRPVSDDPAAAEELRGRLAALPGVDLAELDLAWLKRLAAILDIAERAILILAGLLGSAVLLIVGNTTRLAVISRRDEIEVIGLVGGTAAFIRRPFLYNGLLQGFAAGLLAWLLVTLSVWLVSGPVEQLTSLYGTPTGLRGLGLGGGLTLAVTGSTLGWFGARVAVGWQLRRFDRR